MKHSNTAEPGAYRVQDPEFYKRITYRFRHADKEASATTIRLVRALRYLTWRRTWQAEWDGCQRAARAWTRRGVERKSRRWMARS